MPLPGLRKLSLAVALLLGTASLAACGESAQDKAKAQVCSARSDIAKQITKLEGLTISSSTVSEAEASFKAIGNDLSQIKKAQPNLDTARKEQVETATKTFESQLSSITSGVISKLGSENPVSALTSAGPAIKSAVSQLATDYKQALGPISCP